MPQRDCAQHVESLRLWDGAPLPAGLRHRLVQAWEHGTALTQRIARLEAERRAVLRTAEDAVTKKVQHLLVLKGVGINSAWLFVMEFFGWRALRNRKEVDALSSLSAYSGAFCPPSRTHAAPQRSPSGAQRRLGGSGAGVARRCARRRAGCAAPLR
jgi:hypothetical protein